MISHPSDDQLKSFSAGISDEDASVSVESHLESCEQCVQRLSSFSEDDRLIELVREAAHNSQAALFFNESDSAETHALTFAKYDLLSELGRGGMGVVYRARDRQLKRDVALKVILTGVHSTKEERKRFQHEAEILAKFQHPGFVQIFEVGEQDGHPFLALEYIDGPTLHQWLDGKQQSPECCALMLLQLAEAMQAAHQQSIIHRDLKPSNVLIQGQSGTLPSGDPSIVPKLKITDFGLAKHLDTNNTFSRSGFAAGTPAYMAPEQAMRNDTEIGCTADVYSLGAILYEMLTGRPPFVGGDSMALVLAVMNDDPVEPHKLRFDLPRPLETICLKCLMKSPADRYATASELAADLRSFLMNEPIQARSISLFGILMRWARRHPALAASYLVGLSLFALHLCAKYLLQLPKHQSEFGWIAATVTAGSAVCSTLLEPVLRHPRWGVFSKYLYVALGYAVAIVILSWDRGPRSAPMPLFLIGIMLSSLLLPSVRMIAYSTAISLLSYAALLAAAFIWYPENSPSAEEAIAFFLSLILIGTITYLLYRRPQVNRWRRH